jgi:putative lipoprotein
MGKITIPGSPSLPDDAVVTVELVEQRRGETVLPALARETMRWHGLTSLKFAIRFDPSLIEPMDYYAVQARIIAGGKVWFETDYPQPVAPLSGDPMHLALTAA